MNVHEWKVATDPSELLSHLRGRISHRKLCLFVCACARRAMPNCDDKFAAMIEEMERTADDRTGVVQPSEEEELIAHANDATTRFAFSAILSKHPATVNDPYAAERAIQCDLLRDIFGNPFDVQPPS